MVSEDGEVIQEKNERFTDSMNDEGYRFPSHKLGARMFADVKFPKEMSDGDIGKMARLAKVMVGKTNMLGYRKGNNIVPYTAQEIGKLVGLNHDRNARDFVNRMLKQRMIQRVETNSGSQFYINPAYFMANGQRLLLDIFLLFRDELKDLLPNWVMKDFLRQARTKQTV